MMRKTVLALLALLMVAGSGSSWARLGGSTTQRNDEGMAVYDGSTTVESADEISGIVLNSQNNKPIKNATVEMKNINLGIGFYVVKTDSSGRFSIKDYIKNITYKIDVSADGYVSYKGTSYSGTEKMKIYLHPESRISGTVTDSSGKALTGVDIRVQPYYRYNYDRDEYGEDEESSENQPGNLLRPSVSDSDGKYAFNKLVNGSYYISFSKSGYIAETVQIKNVKIGEEFRLNMKLFKPATVSGTLKIDKLGIPAANLNVYLYGNQTYSAVSFDDGSFSIDDLKPGLYEMRVYHPGFNEQRVEKILIKEGAVLSSYAFTMVPKEPAADVSSYRYTFAPGQAVNFEMRTFRIDAAKITLYSVPASFFLKGQSDPMFVNPTQEKFEKMNSWKEAIRDFTPYEWRYQTLNISKPLPTGGYCIEIAGEEGVFARKFFSVTSVGTVIKRSPSSVFVYASNLVTNEPVKDAKIVLYNNSSTHYSDSGERIENLPAEEFARAVTDSRGIAQVKCGSTENVVVLAVASDHSYAIASAASSSWLSKEANRILVYTDRPVYRAGDTVFYKIIAKKRSDILTPMAGTKFYYRIENGDNGKVVADGTGEFDEWGSFNAKVKVEESAGLGTFYIKIGESERKILSSGKFYVEQYRKPEFKVEVTPAKEFFLNGETAEFKVDARYFFGAPLKNAIIKYKFYETRADFSYAGGEDSSRTVYDRLRLEGEKNLDNSGVAVLKIDTAKLPFDRKITLEATVIDASNVSISSSGSVRVGKGEYYIKIKPAKSFFDAAEVKTISVQTMSQAGTPVSANVELGLYRYIWKPYQRVYLRDKKPVYSVKVSTDAKGKGSVDIPAINSYGEFELVAKGADRFGNEISSSYVVTLFGGSGDIESKIGNLEIEADKTELEKPEELTLLVKSRYTDAYVCITVEGKDVYLSNTVKMKGNIMPVKIPIKAEYAPNFFIVATMQRGRALYTAEERVSLPVKNTTIKITAKPDKEKYLPGEKAVIALKATDVDGNPVKADLSLAAVDEAIFSIRSDHTPEMNSFFYAKISNWVLTTYSYPINVYAGAGKEGKTKVRTKFDDTAYWNGRILTDAKGEAKVEFVLPDNLTTWRLTVRGHDLTGRVGEVREKFMVTQDLVSRVGKPRFFVEGDDVSLLGIVTSNTARGLSSVQTKLTINGKEQKGDSSEKISLPGYGTHSRDYTTSVPSGKEMVLQFDSYADTDAKDAVQYTVPIEKRGSRYRLFGITEPGKPLELKFLKNADDYEFIPEKAVVTLNPSPIYQMLNACTFLSRYPYGCVEQTINKFLPSLALQKMLEMKNVSIGDVKSDDGTLADIVNTGIARVQSMQNSDGTWGWFAGDRGNEFLTSYALQSLNLSASYGYSINSSVVNQGLRAIERMFNEYNSSEGRVSSPEALANMLFVYSLYGKWNNGVYLDLKKGSRNGYQNAFLARALAIKNAARDKQLAAKGLDGAKELSQMMKDLTNSMKRDGNGPYWSSPYNGWRWEGDDTELTAHALAAYVAAGDKSSIPAQIVVSLSKRASGGIWVSTKETASVILAMTNYFQGEDNLGTEAGSVSLKINGKDAGVIAFDPANKSRAYDKNMISFSLDDKGITGPITIESTGTAGKGATLGVVVEGTLKFKPKGFASLFKSENRSLKKLSNGISVTRSYYTLKRVFDSAGAEFLIPEEINEGDPLKAGDEIMVKVRFSAQDDFEYLMLEDFLPSGFEVSRVDAYNGYKYYSHAERWDNRVVYFFSSLRKGEVYEAAYTVRAELAGKFMARPGTVECMYEPSIQGWSAPSEIEVKKK